MGFVIVQKFATKGSEYSHGSVYPRSILGLWTVGMLALSVHRGMMELLQQKKAALNNEDEGRWKDGSTKLHTFQFASENAWYFHNLNHVRKDPSALAKSLF